MNFKIAPLWWPVVLLLSPILIPVLLVKYFAYVRNRRRVESVNMKRLDAATPLELPEADYMRLSVLVDWKSEEGYIGDAGVSYFIETNLGSLLFDVGHGPENKALLTNTKNMGFSLDAAQAVVISHLHKDHMGGLAAAKKKEVTIPEALFREKQQNPMQKICYLPDKASCGGMETELVDLPKILLGGIASTGALARSLFFFGYTEEQALVVRVRDRGLVVITGCGHPTIETILAMVRKMSDEPIYAIIGGLHFPVKEGRGDAGGIQLQRVIGTGKPPWKNITDEDLMSTAATINGVKPHRVLLSGHDSDDYALQMFSHSIEAEVETLFAGRIYSL